MYKLSPIKEETFYELQSEKSENNIFILFINFILHMPNRALIFLSECIKIDDDDDVWNY